jgi:hypothetical protein
MITIALDTGSTLSVLNALLDQRNVQAVSNAAAESYNDDVHDWIDAGRGFTPRSPGGGLEQAINWHPNGDGSATVYANKQYAGYVEDGTGPHIIRPRDGRRALRFPVGGGSGFAFAREIHHPGSVAKPYFFIDRAARAEHMQERALSVLAARMARA